MGMVEVGPLRVGLLSPEVSLRFKFVLVIVSEVVQKVTWPLYII